MNRPGTVLLDWGDGEQVFRLGFGELEELQEKTDCGPVTLLDRLRTGAWRVRDIRETLRLALIGGGKKPVEAVNLVRRYVDAYENSLLDNAPVAAAVLLAALAGTKEQAESAGEPTAEKAASETKTDVSPSPPSGPTSEPSGIPLSISTPSQSSKRSRSSKAGTGSKGTSKSRQ